MLKLYGKLPILNSVRTDSYLATVGKSTDVPKVLRNRRVLLRQSSEDGKGYKAILTKQSEHHESDVGSDVFIISSAHDLSLIHISEPTRPY